MASVTTKIGRNDPCRCGSGKKYKRCCVAADEAPAVERARVAAAKAADFARHSAEINARLRSRPAAARADAMDIAELENEIVERARLAQRALDRMDAGRFDEAIEICDGLERDHPEEVDGIELRALLHEARGDTATAAQLYRRALDFTLPRDHFDEELRDSYRQHIRRLEALTANAASTL
jgi:tetratricopeptide (TPR) repeat protein